MVMKKSFHFAIAIALILLSCNKKEAETKDYESEFTADKSTYYGHRIHQRIRFSN